MQRFSIVMIAKNEAAVLGKTLNAIEHLSDDIIVVDSGSIDSTQQIAKQFGATILETSWDGFGNNKNKGAAIARYEWILNLDADEVVQPALFKALQKISFSDAKVIYAIKRLNFFGSKAIKHGEWGNDEINRLYNKNTTRWNTSLVHEELENSKQFKRIVLPGEVYHLTAENFAAYETKMKGYALLSAARYNKEGKKSNWLKRKISPLFSFAQNYFFKLGFLDGKEGFAIARLTARYTFLKYAKLYELNRISKAE